PRMALGLMNQRTPHWERVVVRMFFPAVRVVMKRIMRIDERTVVQSRDTVLRVFDDVERRLADGRPYLAGDRFTAADLTFAALAAVGVMPPEHAMAYPSLDALPRAVTDLVRETQVRPAGAFVRRLYREHRAPRV
ncbi:MAG TPA: glutathione binding-like protein, partial [Polyangiaceae bacterium]|nr:glutathione binding-like protein [Polyangiaceae bacterium]